MKHWSQGVAVLCWCDPKSGGRRRMSWGTKEHLYKLAHKMTEDCDAVLYDGLGKRVPLRPPVPPDDKPAKRKDAAKHKPKPKAEPSAV